MKFPLGKLWHVKLVINQQQSVAREVVNSSSSSQVDVVGLHYQYPGALSPALNDINLNISAGSCFGLLGPNGAGKTTLISLLTGLLTPQQGEIEVAGLELVSQAKRVKRLSALVPQDYAFYPALSGLENIEFFAGLYQVPAAELSSRIENCVEICGLSRVLEQRAADYSGGIKRRLNIALGLLSNPKILYLDEPTVGIDAQSRFFILQAIEQLKASGMTIVYTSHYMEEVEQICDEVAIIDGGRMVLQEQISSLLQGSRELQIGLTDTPSAQVLATLQQRLGTEWDGSQLKILPDEKHSLEMIMGEIERAGLEVKQLYMGKHRLEEIYLNVTRRELRK